MCNYPTLAASERVRYLLQDKYNKMQLRDINSLLVLFAF